MEIIDGFQLNASKPIDTRLVTSGTASRDSIAYKYNGLRVYDTDAKQPFVWNGTIWTSENSSTVTITGTTTNQYIPVFNGTSQISNSLISQISTNAGKYVNIANGNADIALKVNGMLVANSIQGSGVGLTNVPGSSITGTIDINKIKPYTAGPNDGGIYILKSGLSTPEWISLSSIPAGSLPSAAPSIDISTGAPLYVSFTTTTGQSKYYQTPGGDAFRFIPRVGATEGAQLQIPNGSEANPSLAFSVNANTGIYRAGWNILGISVNGKEKMRLAEGGVLVKSTSIYESTLKIQNSAGRPFLALYGLNGDSKMSGTIGFSGLWNGQGGLNDLIIENFAGTAARTYNQTDAHFDAAVPIATDARRHMINMNVYGQTLIATNVGSVIGTFNSNGFPDPLPNATFPNGAYGCDISNSNPSLGHGLIVRSGGGPNTVSARFDNGNKTIAYFTDRGLQIMSGTVDSPSICFDVDKSRGINTGLYLEQSSTIGVVAGSKKVLTISDREIRLSKVSNLAYIFGDNTRLEGTTRTNSIEIYRPTTNPGWAICHFYSDIGGVKAAKAYIWPDGSYYRLSDRRQKENIMPLEYGLNEILRLNPVTHTWLYSQPAKPSIGLIAQEVEEVVGELVNTTMDGDREIKALDYNGLIPILIKSIQDLNKKIEILESK